MQTEQRHVLARHYDLKAESYFTSARSDYVDALPSDPAAHILELGCGDGATGALALRSGKACNYVGIEASEAMAERARKVLTDVIVGDVERMDLALPPGSFDALILSEVLEHLADPGQTLATLVSALKPGALVMASSPNVAHWKNVLNLARGRFEYTDSGMMDRTHLKWFTPASFAQMFADVGIRVTRLEPLNHSKPITRTVAKLVPILKPMTFFQINLHGIYEPRHI